MILTDGWTSFWSDVWKSITDAWNQVVKFWAGDGESIPYVANFLLAIIVLLLGVALIKFIIFIINRAFKINRGIIKERSVKSFIVSTIKIILYFILVLIVLNILRVSLTGVAEIFSSAILAIGLSLQDVISNFASGIIILTSKPFVTGDYIKIGESTVEGNVVDVRFLVTTIETVNKQVVTIPNKTITGSIITNYTKNPLRRVVVDIGVDYSTDINKAKAVLVEIANKDNRVLLDPKPVCYVTAFESSDINLSLRCYVPNALYWDVYFELNEKILIEFNRQGIKIPYNRLVIESLNAEEKINLENKGKVL